MPMIFTATYRLIKVSTKLSIGFMWNIKIYMEHKSNDTLALTLAIISMQLQYCCT